MPRYVPLWLDRFPKARRPAHPRLRGELETRCDRHRRRPDRMRLRGELRRRRHQGRRPRGRSDWRRRARPRRLGLIREDFDASFEDTARAHGLRAARTLWQGMRRASLDFAAAIKRANVRCDLVPQDLLHVAPPRDGDAVKRLRREYDARRAAGFDHTWMTAAALAREAAVEGGGAIRTRGFAFDPFRACLGFAESAAARGATFFERTPVRRIRAGRKIGRTSPPARARCVPRP